MSERAWHKVTKNGATYSEPLRQPKRHPEVHDEVKIAPRSTSRLLRVLDATWGRVVKAFPRSYITLGNSIYYPGEDFAWAVIEHELVHVEQCQRVGAPVFWLTYALGLPLPIFFAWFRWRWEREAYLRAEILTHGLDLRRVENAICSSLYLWPWPRRLVRRWLEAEYARRTS